MSPVTRRWQRDLDHAEASSPIQRGMKVRLIADPETVLTVREVDVYGRLDGTGKVLCFNSFGHGKWLPISELEIAP